MQNKVIVIAGATGNLGKKIARELIQRGATVRALVRTKTDPDKISSLKDLNAEICEVDFDDTESIARACAGVTCMISALAGLRDVIVDLQQRLLDVAISEQIPRFIPSDFCTDYNQLVPGENRNFDLRREFKTYLDSKPIQASSVFNGAFSDILRYNTPVLNLKDKSIGYWGEKADWKLDFTTMDDTAAFTAEVALDDSAPRDLQIASFQVSPEDLVHKVKEITGEQFSIRKLGELDEFLEQIKMQRKQDPSGEEQLYARWQQAQYLYSMFTTHHDNLANNRYQNLSWTSGRDFLETLLG